MKLVDNASNWRRWWSMRWAIATAFLAAIPVAYMTLPPDWLPSIPDWFKAALALATLFSAGATGVSRVLKQPKVEP